MCGGTGISGHAFCLGLNGLKIPGSNNPGLQGIIRSMAYLIRGAIFRPKHAVSTAGGASLGELLDMYHNRKATVRNDKVYALLGMSSDDPSVSGLVPNYTLPWSNLLRQLIEFLLPEATSIEVFEEREIALIKSKGWVVGQVSMTKSDNTRYDRQQVEINFTNTPASSKCQRRWGAQWTLQASAESIRQGDIVCLLEGASKPTIVRTSEDYFYVIIIAVTPLQHVGVASTKVKLQWSLPSLKGFSQEFLLMWNWEKPLENLQEPKGHKSLSGDDALVLQWLKNRSNRATRLFNVALVLKNVEEYEDASKRLEELLGDTEKMFADEHPYQLANIEIHALIWKRAKKWWDAEDMFLRVIKARQQVYGVDHPDTLDNIAHLVSIYIAQNDLGTQEPEMTQSLATRVRENAEITQGELLEVVQKFDNRMLALLLNLRRDKVVITQEVVKAAVENKYYRKELMTLLLDQRGADVPITEEVVKAAAGNYDGKELMTILLDRRGADVPITEEVMKAAAGNYHSKELMTLLLDRRGADVLITEEVVKAAVENKYRSKGLMTLLLDRRGADVVITEEVVKAAARSQGKEVMKLLLDQRRADVPITEEVVKAAAGNQSNGEEVMTLLLDQRGADVQITEEAAARIVECFDRNVVALLLDRQGADVPITEEVVKATAGNQINGEEVMTLLLNRRGTDVPITEEVVKAAAGEGSIYMR
jgi:tetratricopeptide (TPR) repeat protein